MQKVVSRSWKFRATAAAVALNAAFVSGCYAYAPSQTSLLQPGKDVALAINDMGRVNLSTQVGAEVAQLAGILESQTNSEYSLRVSEVTFLNGRTAVWSGEPVKVRQEYVKDVLEKKISPRRTLAAVVAGAGVVGGAIVAHTLVSGGNGNGGEGKPEPPPGTGYRGHQ
jgi:hypothetical protein